MNLNSLTAIFAAGSTIPALLAASLPTCSASVQPALELVNRVTPDFSGKVTFSLKPAHKQAHLSAKDDKLVVF